MAAIYTVQNGVTAWDEQDVNQYAQTFSNVLGVTDTAQLDLGRLVLPRLAANPGAPIAGQTWWRTNLGDAGRLHILNGAGAIVPYLPIRQRVEASQTLNTYFNLSSASFVDITGLTLSITTTGGRLLIGLLINPVSDGADFYINQNPALPGVQPAASVRAVVGATNLAPVRAPYGAVFLSGVVPAGLNISGTVSTPPPGFVWDYKPVAGTYTVKVQIAVAGASMSGAIKNTSLVVLEYADA